MIFRVAAMALTAALMIGPAHSEPAVDKPAPAFTAVDSNGKTHNLADYRGKTVVLEWTNHDCPYVRKHYGANNMQTLQKEATADGVVWLSVISSGEGKQGHVSADEANKLTEERGAAPTAVLFDENGKIGRSYGARTTPHMYIVNPEGTLVYMGGIDNKPTSDPDDIATATNYVKVALDSLKAGKPIQEAVTRPYGCSVHYSSQSASLQ